MNDFLKKPSPDDAPSKKSGLPWEIRLEYKSGKTPAAFAAIASPEAIKAGFSFYDKEAKTVVRLESLTASIVAVTAGVSGTTQEHGNFVNYWSNLVFDSRVQRINVSNINGLLASGLYREIKDSLPDGVGYTKVLIVYLHELKKVASLALTVALEWALIESIANACGLPPKQVSIYDLCNKPDTFWTFRHSGEFTKRTKTGETWKDSGEMYFWPVLSAGVASASDFDFLPSIAHSVNDYVWDYQSKFEQPAAPVMLTGQSVAAAVTRNTQPSNDAFAGLTEPPAGDEMPF